jgi:serine/threonine-protein kinase
VGRLLRGDLSAIVLKALESSPARRYGTVRQFSDDIEAYLEGQPVQARPQTALYRTGKFLRRRWLPITVAAVFVTAISAAAIVSLHEARVAREEASKAEKVNQFLTDMLSSGSGFRFDPERLTVAEMLEASEPLLSTRWKDDPLTRAVLQRSLGASYTAIHRLDRGKAQLDSALATFRARGDDKEIASTLLWLSANLVESGRLEEGVACLDDALTRVRRMGKNAPPLLAFSIESQLATLLTVYLNRRIPESLALFHEAIDRARRDPAIPRTEMAVAMSHLAGMLGTQGKIEEAERMTQEALAIGRTEDPGGSWEIGPLYELAILHSRQKDMAGATEYARQRYENMVRHLGEDSVYTASSRAMWARGLAESGNTGEALRQLDAAMPIVRKAYQPLNANLWTPVVAASRIYCKAGIFAKAEAYAREALQIVDAEGLPKMDTRRAESLFHLGAALHGEQQDAAAFPVLQQSLAIYRQSGPAFANSVERVQTLLNGMAK